MQGTIKYIGWPIETKKPQDNNNNNKNRKEQTQNEIQKTKWETQNRKTLPENRNRNPKTEISITNRQHTQKNTKLNRKTETESKNTNHSHKRRKQKQGNSLKYCLSCFIVFVLNRRLFRESMIAGYNYLRTSICKSISFQALDPGDGHYRFRSLLSLLARGGLGSRTGRQNHPGSVSRSP